MRIYIGADHHGFELKEELKSWLQDADHQVIDCGNERYDLDDDFPDFAIAVAEKVQQDSESRGIVICGSGVGANIAANKVRGIRASLVNNVLEVVQGRADDNLNVIALSADFINLDLAQEIINSFLSTNFKGEKRHLRRLQKITHYESLS